METVAKIITDKLIVCGAIEEEEAEIYQFGFSSLLADILQWTTLVVLALLLRCLAQVLTITVFFKAIKGNYGGWHCMTRLGCYLTTTGFLLVAARLVLAVPAASAFWVTALLGLCACGVIFTRDPLEHPNNPKTQEDILRHKQIGRLLAIAMAVTSATAAYFLPERFVSLPLSGSAGIFIAAATLIIPLGKEAPI